MVELIWNCDIKYNKDITMDKNKKNGQFMPLEPECNYAILREGHELLLKDQQYSAGKVFCIVGDILWNITNDEATILLFDMIKN